jgi:hypothetical protein
MSFQRLNRIRNEIGFNSEKLINIWQYFLHDLTTEGGDVYRQIRSMFGMVGGDEAF